MPVPELDNLKQTAVLWRYSGENEFNEPTVYYPIEISVRWERMNKEMIRPDGTPRGVDVSLFVDQDIDVRSIVWLGSLEDAYPDPPSSELYEVVSFDDVPDIKGQYHQRTAMLAKYNNSLPEIVPGTGTGSGTGA